MNRLAAGIVMTCKGMPFFQAGEEFARTKHGEGNSFKSPWQLNKIDWTRALEQEELVEIYPNRGAYVKGITYKDVEDIFRIRARLEGLCAEMAVSSITHEQLDKLDEIILLSKFYEEKKDMEHLLKMDSQFHEVLFESCGSKMLEHQLKDYHQYVQKARLRSLKRQERAKKSTQEHEEILLAIKDKDAKRADELATRHILNAIANIRLEHES